MFLLQQSVIFVQPKKKKQILYCRFFYFCEKAATTSRRSRAASKKLQKLLWQTQLRLPQEQSWRSWNFSHVTNNSKMRSCCPCSRLLLLLLLFLSVVEAMIYCHKRWRNANIKITSWKIILHLQSDRWTQTLPHKPRDTHTHNHVNVATCCTRTHTHTLTTRRHTQLRLTVENHMKTTCRWHV